jgi:hypothetical protein
MIQVLCDQQTRTLSTVYVVHTAYVFVYTLAA